MPQKRCTRPRLRRGFTLIEILMVIVIIGLLTAILFPVFGRARESARRSSCSSSLKQIGIAYNMYVSDYDERTPSINTFPGSAAPLWSDRLMPYVGSTALFSGCPAKNFPGTWAPNSKSNLAFAYNNLYNSTSNTIDGQRATPPSGNPNSGTDVGVLLSQFEVPSETVVLGDGQGQYMVYGTNKSTITVDLNAPYPLSLDTTLTPPANIGFPNIGRDTTVAQRFVGRHFGGANFMFGDGHVKWLPMTEVAKTNGNGVMYYFTLEDDKNWGPGTTPP